MKRQDYLLRDRPAELWKAAKVFAAQNDTTLRELILQGLAKVIGFDKK